MNVDRYLAVVAYARRRFTRGGLLVISIGAAPSPYSRIEAAAWNRYMKGSA